MTADRNLIARAWCALMLLTGCDPFNRDPYPDDTVPIPAEPDSGVPVTCGNGVIDDLELCDPNASNPALQCGCTDDEDRCTAEVFVFDEDAPGGRCLGVCERTVQTGYGFDSCDDGDPSTDDTLHDILGGSACDIRCEHTPACGNGTVDVGETCDFNAPPGPDGIASCRCSPPSEACFENVVVSGTAQTCDVVCEVRPSECEG